MNALCFNSMNRSAYLLGEEDPDLLGQIEAAGRAGFAGFGPDAYSIDRYCRAGGRLEALGEAIAAAGLRTFELPTLLVGPDRDQVAQDIERLAGYARVLRPDFVQLNVDGPISDATLDDLRRAGDVFGPLGARLAIEYLPWLEAVRDIRSTRALLARAGVAGAGVLVDTWHFTHGADDWSDLEALPLDELAYVQFDDHPPLLGDDLVEETLSRRVMPGEGEFELTRFCERIKAKGYSDMVSCEVLSTETRRWPRDRFATRVYESSAPYWND